MADQSPHSREQICGYCGNTEDAHRAQDHVFDPVGGTPSGPRTLQQLRSEPAGYEAGWNDCMSCRDRVNMVAAAVIVTIVGVFSTAEYLNHHRQADRVLARTPIDYGDGRAPAVLSHGECHGS